MINRTAKSWVVSLLLLGIIAYGAAHYLDRLGTLLGRIVPSSSVVLSTSMEPYDIVLRLQPKDNDGRSQPWEWHLRFPRAFVTSESGTNGVTYGRSRDGGDHYNVDVQALVSEDGKTFIPAGGQPIEKQKARSLVIHLRNGSALLPIQEYNLCVPQDLEGTILKSHGDSIWQDSPCYQQELRCRISMHLDGWSVDFAATKDLYSNPDNACRLTRQLLDSYTVRRDEVVQSSTR